MTMEQIEIVHAMMERYPDAFGLALTSGDIRRIQGEGRIASLIGVEGGHAIENSLEKLNRLYAMGARYMTLTHSDSLAWADACSDQPNCGGLSEFGRDVVKHMNRLGMLVGPVSRLTRHHAGGFGSQSGSHHFLPFFRPWRGRSPTQRSRLDSQANGPTTAAWSWSTSTQDLSYQNRCGTRGLCLNACAGSARNMGDDEESIRRESADYKARHPVYPGTVHHVVDHIDHIVQIAGIDHVGLGSDYDGIGVVPQQLEDVSTYPVLTQVLVDRGYTESQIHQILNGNINRVIHRAEAVADSLAE